LRRSRISASVANRKGFKPGTFEALTSFSQWSPRTSSITISSSCITTRLFTVFSIGMRRNAETSSHVCLPGVATFCSGCVAAARVCKGATASASSTFAA
jgi:hypothetical protein